MPSYLPMVIVCSRRNGYYASTCRVQEEPGSEPTTVHRDYGDGGAIPRCGNPLYLSRSGAYRYAANHLLPKRARRGR
ncbi:MAG: hypothetical protein AAF333_13195 [Planctomycetota bacterium]